MVENDLLSIFSISDIVKQGSYSNMILELIVTLIVDRTLLDSRTFPSEYPNFLTSLVAVLK